MGRVKSSIMAAEERRDELRAMLPTKLIALWIRAVIFNDYIGGDLAIVVNDAVDILGINEAHIKRKIATLPPNRAHDLQVALHAVIRDEATISQSLELVMSLTDSPHIAKGLFSHLVP